MRVEVSVALNFVISYLYNKLPRRRVDGFGEILERGLEKKFEGHWYPDKPFKGSAFRCIRVSGEEMDPVIESSAARCGIDMQEIREYLPRDLTIWVDPNEVSYRIGEKGAVKILYSVKRPEQVEDNLDMDKEVQNANRGFNPEAQSFRPIDSLSSSLTNLSLSPSPDGWGHSISPTQPPSLNSTSPVTSYLTRQTHPQTFTAAAFAATKFGSTKLKTQAKRPSRLSPTEFGAYVKHQRSGFQMPSPVGHPGMIPNGFYGVNGTGMMPGAAVGPNPLPGHHHSLSPRDVHNDYFEHQQRFLLLQQQQQHKQQQQQQQQQQQGFLPQPNSPQTHNPQQSLLMGASDLLSPVGGSLGDLYLGSLSDQQQHSPTKMLSAASSLQATPSPTEQSKTFLDSLNWNTLPPYANLHHLLVAN